MREYSLGRLLLIVGMLCIGSLTMHYFVFSKKPEMHYQHYDPKDAERMRSPVPVATPVEGTIAAIGIDRVHVQRSDGHSSVFRCEKPGQYKVGQKVRVTYAEGPTGEPPLALKIEVL